MAKKTLSDKKIRNISIVGGIITTLILAVGTILIGISATNDADKSAKKVSLFYLNELVQRRNEVVETNLDSRKKDLNKALEVLSDDDLSSEENLKDFQRGIKNLYELEKFAFVDEDGTIYTSTGQQHNIDEYKFDYNNLTTTEVSIFNLESKEKRVVIASPTDKLFLGKQLKVCFMEIAMDTMLNGISISKDESTQKNTFVNLYTKDGVALTDKVLGGLSSEYNLFSALKEAKYESGYSYDNVYSDFQSSRSGIATFVYNNLKETLAYSPIRGTDWVLTYLIRDENITRQISSVSTNIFVKSLIVAIIVASVLVAMFVFIILQLNKNAKMKLANETVAIENKIKQEDLEQRLDLQEKLLIQEKEKNQQNQLITALSSDYWSVYYIVLDKDDGICYQQHSDIEDGLKVGDEFKYLETFQKYAEKYVIEKYREDFLRFIQPENIKKELINNRIISFRYIVSRHNKETYEMVRFAGVRHPEDRDDGIVHAVGACFTNIDDETRTSIAQNQLLSEALSAAEQASKAKTIFLSNMSHEIRTPMNAIIGLDKIALQDSNISEKTKDYLEKIGASAEHLLNLINDILDMSRIESGKMVLNEEEFSLSKLLEYINNMFLSQCKENDLIYSYKIDKLTDDIYLGDSIKIRQILINILGNAVKFTNAGGHVDFIVKEKASYKDQVTLKFTIKDTGCGMSEEFLPHVFDSFAQEKSFSTNKYGSSGLGLAITKNIVEMMNGKIEVESKKNIGTTFVVELTLTKSNNAIVEEKVDVVEQDNLKGKHVLVAEDMEINAEIIKTILESKEMIVDLTSNGKEVIEKFKNSEIGYYSLILMDIRMPEMDGLEATQVIRKLDRKDSNIPIIAMSANAFDEDVQRSLQSGLNAHLTKPIQTEILFETLKKFLNDSN